MKIVLVDDEIMALRGVQYILQKNKPAYEITGIFEDGKEALRFLQTAGDVDVLVTDIKMGVISGVELIEQVKAAQPGIDIIALSAYSDFDYVRSAMQKGACDYLLKPCRHEDIIALLERIEHQRGIASDQQQQLKLQAQLISVFAGTNASEADAPPLPDFEGLLLLAPSDPSEPYAGQPARDWLASCLADAQLAVPMEGEDVIILMPGAWETLDRNELYCQMSNRGLILSGAYVPLAGQPDKRTALQAAKRILEFLRFNGLTGVMTFAEHNELSRQDGFSVKDTFNVNLAVGYIKRGEHNKLLAAIKSFFATLKDSRGCIDPVRLKKGLGKTVVELETELKNFGLLEDANDKTLTGIDYANTIGGATTLAGLEAALQEAAFGFYDLVHTNGAKPRYVLEATRYIEQNYMEDLSLRDIADVVFLNEWHFSAQFKKHMGLSVTEYLNSVRITKAKELLKQRDLKVFQVAEMVGFQNSAYFSTVFKSFEGVSPKKYQQNIL